MSVVVPVVLAAAAAAVGVAPSRAGALRLHAVAPPPAAGGSVTTAVAAAGGIAALLLGGPAAALLALTGALVVQRWTRRRGSDAVTAAERAAALNALSLLSADLRAGRTPAEALGAASQVALGGFGAALAAAAAAAHVGADVAPALVVGGSAAEETLRALAACWRVCGDAGSGLAASVERLEEGMRAAAAQRRSVAAELAGPRATAQLLALLPLLGVGLAAALGAHPLAMLLHTPVGLGCLVVGLGLDAAGVLWTRRLTERALA